MMTWWCILNRESLPEGNSTFSFIFGRKLFQQIFDPYYFFMNYYAPDLYKEILECYNYETRNPSIYGNVIRSEVELTQSSEELRSDAKGDENHI